MPQTSALNTEFDRARAELARLSMPGVLGFYTHFEVTEVFAIRDEEHIPFNVFSILVAEEREGFSEQKPFYLGKHIRLKSLDGCMFGIQRFLCPVSTIAHAFEHFQRTAEWQLSGKRLHVGPLIPAPTQFVPADSTERVPWNNVLKNNFWSGSHIVEWIDPEKAAVKSLFDEPPRLQELSEAIQKQAPIRLASLSDRLGNVVIQVPGNVVVADFAKAHTGEAIVRVQWHPKAAPRSLRATCATQFDNAISGYASGTFEGSELVLPMQDAQGTLRGVLWDDQNQLIVAATASTSFIKTVGLNMGIADPEPRVFTVRNPDGSEETCRVGLSTSRYTAVRAPGPDGGEKWTHQRIYRDEAARLAQSRRFVQYNPIAGQQDAEHDKALRDIRALINQYGEKGACLWDPYLSAEDILRTLFYCSHHNSILRALTAGQEYPSGSIPKPTLASLRRQSMEWLRQTFWKPRPKPSFSERQRAVLEAANSNFRGLRLEYRIRTASAGWPFHDRFLIFPGEEGAGARAWSLGTSVNSLGKRHHILQQVDDGQLVMDAFNGLWDELDQSQHLIWKVP
jgi:hypothetical protein